MACHDSFNARLQHLVSLSPATYYSILSQFLNTIPAMSSLLETKASPGKGLGVSARQDIKAGTRIMKEGVAVVFPSTKMCLQTTHQMLEILRRQPETIQNQFWALQEGAPRDGMSRLYRILTANSFGLDDQRLDSTMGILLGAYRSNHSCVSTFTHYSEHILYFQEYHILT